MDAIAETLAASLTGRYRVGPRLGAGGMAGVYRAHDVKHDRDVAIKVMHPELAARMGSERFLREIRLLARLQHPNILSLVDSGEAGGLLYYVMPYLADGSLRERLERERELPVREAIRILREIAEALEHAHAHEIVHRDIKPENVLFSAGHALVADFGIARVADKAEAGTILTTVGTTIGTPQYMAPEQASGDPRTDHRADLYALGALAYEMLAGSPVFVASSLAQLAAMHLTETPFPLSRRRPTVPAALNELVMRCLHKRPADRWQSARELIAALDRVDTSDGATVRRSIEIGTIAARLPISEALASRIERANFDPRMIGDTIEYLDNRAGSDVVVMLLNAAWLDAAELEPHVRVLPYRCFAPTLFGFAPQARQRFALSAADHLALLAELLRVVVEDAGPSIVIVVGFSASADLVMNLAANAPEGGLVPDGVLALGPNQALETCFISAVLARLESDRPEDLLKALRTISQAATSLDEWIVLNGYLGRIMNRFRADVSPLRTLAHDIVEPFQRDPDGAFAAMYRGAAARAKVVRCLFEDSEVCNRLLRQILTDQMDRRVLGEHHRDGALLIEPTPGHFDLLQPERIAKHLAAMVEELRAGK
jgi:tRNA A-37 threonylcarbamoyl transferase component Bud32/pimeloyl-ACP methyl ester carboxylesterase